MVDALISPQGQLDLLTKSEIELLQSSNGNEICQLFHNCALAVLSTGANSDDGSGLLAAHPNFEINVVSSARGVKLQLRNAPDNAFVNKRIITGIGKHLFAVLRDIIYLHEQYRLWENQDETITDMVFKTLRNAHALIPNKNPNLIVCWGGHSINNMEYQYTKEVGYRLGLRNLDICTGCGIGAMKGPMKGAAIAHAKQHVKNPRYIGITEPSIIASEAPNAIVNELIIMPDIEKRLEAFLRMAHGIVVFPGGVGTAEEILYLLGIFLHQANADIALPIVFTGSAQNKDYFDHLDAFIGQTLGAQAQSLYTIIIDNPIEVAQTMTRGMAQVKKSRLKLQDANFFNWSLTIEPPFQHAFIPSHENMAQLNLHKNQSPADLAANLRRAFSGIVAGNIKPAGIQAIAKHGQFEINGDPEIMQALDQLLEAFVAQKRMKLSGDYQPCYKLIH